jgi:vacuolar-type H+-ATPase subunit I/STV1
MTQEELDALMAGDLDLDSIEEEKKEFEDKKDGHEHRNLNDSDLVAELGSVTSDSEKKASEVFDKLEEVLALIDKSDENEENYKDINNDIRNIIFETMSVMQYQDIHRQKIERVINTMRSISQLMNHSLGSVSNTFAPSAKHIAGDENDDAMDSDELEALIKQMSL